MNQNIHYIWVDTNQKLAEVCQNASQKPAVTLDTEFIRIRTYYPKLGLIQLFDGEQVSLIDPTKIDDFAPFIELLANQQVVKVLHACGEDLEVFQHRFKQLPTPLVDTQIMADFAGIGVSMGFAKLVAHYLQIELDKGASRTDWLARPLSEEQLQYAAADVWYLLPVYQRLVVDLDVTRWQNAVEEECQTLLEKRQNLPNSSKAYKDISNVWRLTSAQLAVLQVLAKWRMEEAEKRDLALNFVVKGQNLFEIAKLQPKHTSQLLEFMHPNEVRIHGKKLLLLVEQGKAVTKEDYPPTISRLVDEPGYKHSLKLLQQKLAEIRPLDLAPELLASKRQLNQLFSWFIRGQNPENLPELLKGWRKEFGTQLVQVL
ncbi:ribonuclease D [Actinobacillus ureae]|uniref:Ribonuclease D n=1 Tax=Actinobacillus ureae ATCC 25976 TaxID=887324 RepID=E8KHB1_9PAST|nr:ribonuclease D [Actinobacillus ureae]EFX91739.1 ribonuclease D [Actinobacillus ureae ATCC 25976]SUT86282.1 ribonuclease D [Actinobacillus ureae]SUU45387.1 ribonuclease D [Actinobacillus ureae]